MSDSIGGKLKKERISKKLSLEHVSAETRIKKEFLEWIENNEFQKFDSEVYSKGFIRNYAQYLKLSPDPLFAMYRRDFSEKKFEGHSDLRKTVEKSRQTQSFTGFKNALNNFGLHSRQITITLSLIVVLTIGIIVTRVVADAFKPPFLRVTDPIVLQGGKETLFDIVEDTLVIKGETSPYTSIKINEKIIPLKTGFIFETEPYTITSERTLFTITATSQLGVKTESRIEVLKTGPIKNSLSQMEAIISVKNNTTTLLVNADGEIKFNDVAFPQDGFPINAKNVLEIESSEPENITVLINNSFYILTKQIERFEFQNGEVVQITK
jgi:transcriptional regulator with XRE-family HTH domain